MDNEKIAGEDLLMKIQELQFVAVDLNLYLDNHPQNKNAITDYNTVARELTNMKKLYESQNGPFCNFGCSESQSPWQWVNEPWPWEIGE